MKIESKLRLFCLFNNSVISCDISVLYIACLCINDAWLESKRTFWHYIIHNHTRSCLHSDLVFLTMCTHLVVVFIAKDITTQKWKMDYQKCTVLFIYLLKRRKQIKSEWVKLCFRVNITQPWSHSSKKQQKKNVFSELKMCVRARRSTNLTHLHQFSQEEWAKISANYCEKT